jgi:hypothetical protein
VNSTSTKSCLKPDCAGAGGAELKAGKVRRAKLGAQTVIA